MFVKFTAVPIQNEKVDAFICDFGVWLIVISFVDVSTHPPIFVISRIVLFPAVLNVTPFWLDVVDVPGLPPVNAQSYDVIPDDPPEYTKSTPIPVHFGAVVEKSATGVGVTVTLVSLLDEHIPSVIVNVMVLVPAVV